MCPESCQLGLDRAVYHVPEPGSSPLLPREGLEDLRLLIGKRRPSAKARKGPPTRRGPRQSGRKQSQSTDFARVGESAGEQPDAPKAAGWVGTPAVGVGGRPGATIEAGSVCTKNLR
jgi:hypothetical protein